MAAEKTKRTREELLLLEIADLRSGTAFHHHKPRDGSEPFRCTSPYCEDLGSSNPRGAPGERDDVERYLR